MTAIHLILASASPRRRELLAVLGYPFDVIVSGADEDAHLDAPPPDYVLHTARRKAEIVARDLPPPTTGTRRLIIAADTTVALDDAILGKPATPDEARAMLVTLRGRTHFVHTAICVVEPGGRELSSVHTAAVTMRDYSDAALDAYIATGDPFDKAGGYAIQHPVFRPVEHLSGCYLGVMGLPLCDLIPLLRRLDAPDRVDPARLVDAHRGFLHER
ncbi:MAG: septum formation protein Maf [Anaerolineales bacterium]|uniref:Maf family protein n=1 Tax=Promineifilum sp. TaxID=2664178 RepID=UPI001E044DB3|nr:septum formation protein Maf [Anaerolineales bacterium]MCB8936340.1 septum formation protein Maf [Promineifilum sp.]MCO5179199.1 Maf family protein [Promineifilum sp.]